MYCELLDGGLDCEKDNPNGIITISSVVK